MEWNGMDALLAEYPISNIQYPISYRAIVEGRYHTYTCFPIAQVNDRLTNVIIMVSWLMIAE